MAVRLRYANRRRNFSVGLLLGVALMLGFQAYREQRANRVPDMPPDEAALVATVMTARQQWIDAPNDLARVDLRADRAAALCRGNPSLAVKNWTGRVQGITPDGFPDYFGRKTARIVIGLAPHLSLTTPAAPLLNNPSTMVEAGSPIYATAATLANGTMVIFSATFFPDGADCMAETSLTAAGGMTDPKFKMVLTALASAR